MWMERLKAGKGLKILNGEEEYISMQKEKKLYVRIGAFLVGLYFIGYGIATYKFYISILAVAICLAALFFKDVAVTPKGVEIRYLLPGWHLESPWPWDTITHIGVDLTKARPYVMLHVGRDAVHRILTVTRDEAEAIADLAREKNPSIRISKMSD